MTMYTLTEARRNLAALLEQAAKEGEIRIVGRDGQVFVLKPDVTARSPLDVQGVDLGLTTDEVIAFIREGRRSHDPES